MTPYGATVARELRSALVPLETVSIVDHKYLPAAFRALLKNALFWVVPTAPVEGARAAGYQPRRRPSPRRCDGRIGSADRLGRRCGADAEREEPGHRLIDSPSGKKPKGSAQVEKPRRRISCGIPSSS